MAFHPACPTLSARMRWVDDWDLMFRFVPVTLTDKPMLIEWLSTPHSRTWWGNPEDEIRLIYEGEETGESSGFIVHNEGGGEGHGPFAYIQSWSCDQQPSTSPG